MPDLSSFSIPKYQASDPYYYAYDNKPIDVINQMINLINSQVDVNTQAILNAGGSYTLSQRLNISLYDNGSLKPTALNTALHNIGYHTDGSYSVSSAELAAYQVDYPTVANPVPFVRMLDAEREKLAGIQTAANNMNLSVVDNTTTSTITFSTGTVNLQPSSTIIWKVAGGQIVTAEVTTGLTNAHQHYDNVVPTSATLSPDYKNYTITGPSFRAGSLKVFINGIRIFPVPNEIYAPSSDPSLPWLLNSFTENGTSGFMLTNAITANDIILVDYEVTLS